MSDEWPKEGMGSPAELHALRLLANTRTEVERLKAERDSFQRVGIKAEEQNRALREALRDYGQHAPECVAGQLRAGEPSAEGYRRLYGTPGNDRWYYDGEEPPCSCGLRAALGESK